MTFILWGLEMSNMSLERLMELEYTWRLNRLLTIDEQREREGLIEEINNAIKLQDMFKNSRFGVYNNDFVNSLRKAEQFLQETMPDAILPQLSVEEQLLQINDKIYKLYTYDKNTGGDGKFFGEVFDKIDAKIGEIQNGKTS